MDLNTVNATNPSIDQTVKIFDQFYNYSENVPAMEYDAVYSYFLSVYKNAAAAGNFTVALFRVAQNSSTNVLSLLQELQGVDGPELTLTLAYYLNGIRSPSTLLGLNFPVTPNYYVARNILP